MNQVTVAVPLDEQVWNTLASCAAVAQRDIGAAINELLTEQLQELTLKMEAERIRTLPVAERRELARAAWGGWTLPTGTTSMDLVRQVRAEWVR